MRAAAIGLGIAILQPEAASAQERVKIDYVLPAVTVAAGVSQRITKCPAPAYEQSTLGPSDAGDERLRIGFAFKVAVTGKQSPRRLVRLDAESGFLVDRETKVHFLDDWYLKDFNGKTTGQGGPLLVSLIKAGAAAYAMTVNPILGVGVAAAAVGGPKIQGVGLAKSHFYKKQWYLECQPDVVDRLAKLETLRKDVAGLEGRVIGGDASTSTQDLLILRRAQVGEIEAALTVNATRKLTPTLNPDGSVANLTGQIAAPDILKWFRVNSATREVKTAALAGTDTEPSVGDLLGKRRIPGSFGYQARVTPDAKIAGWFGCDAKATDNSGCAYVSSSAQIDTRDLTFVRPIPATAKLWPNPGPCADGTICEPDDKWTEAADASGSGDVKLPQLSRLFTLRTGGSIFGGRTVGAEFGPMGEPTMLQYDVGGGSKDIAGVIDAGVSGVQTARDAAGAATKRKLDELKNARDLQDLLDELDAT